jgi:hypothetical protein
MSYVDENELLQKFGLELRLIDPDSATLEVVVANDHDASRMVISFSEVTRSLSVRMIEDESVSCLFESENLASVLIFENKKESGLVAEFAIKEMNAKAEMIFIPSPVFRFASLTK